MSSTFSDMKAERDALQREVFPFVRELCQSHGWRFQALDLRWGISEEAAQDQRTTRICLGEIQRCLQVSPRPNFIALLGDRYGWCPLPDEIPEGEYLHLQNLLKGHGALSLLKDWYRKDENAIPPVYWLQPRTGRYADSAEWQSRVEFPLRKALLSVLDQMGLSIQDRLKYEASVTEQEIAAGIFGSEDGPSSSLVFFRTLQGLPQNSQAGDFVNLNEQGQVDLRGSRRLKALKEKLAGALDKKNMYHCESRWQNGAITTEHLGGVNPHHQGQGNLNFCQSLYNRLRDLILQQIQESDSVDSLSGEIESHGDFGKRRSQFFVPPVKALEEINSYLQRPSPYPLVLSGESGSGKTALMGHMAEAARRDFPSASIITRFIGATAGSSGIRTLLEGLCHQISEQFGGSAGVLPQEYRELVREFSGLLPLATREKPLFLFLDALDQLSEADNPLSLDWFPPQLPPQVHLVVSTLPGPWLEGLKKKIPQGSFTGLGRMTSFQGEELLSLWLRERKRTLQGIQRREVMEKFSLSPLPLYLKLAFEEACRWRSSDPVVPLGRGIPGILRNLFDRLSDSSNHGILLVSKALGYLRASKNGLAEDELLDILARDEEYFSHFSKRSFHNLPSEEEHRLPVVLWSRLYDELEPYLTETRSDEVVLLNFYHRQVAEGVDYTFLSGDRKKNFHQNLADYFKARPLYLQEGEPGSPSKPNLRKLSELPYHLPLGGLWSQGEMTLSSPSFLEAKVFSGRTYELLEDCRAFLSLRPQSSLGALLSFLSPRATFFQTYPQLLSCEMASSELPSGAFESQVAEARQMVLKGRVPWLKKTQGGITLGSWLTEPPIAIAFSADGKRVLLGSYGGKISIWDLEGWQLQGIHSFAKGPMKLHVFGDNQHYLLVPPYDSISIVSLLTGDTVKTFENLWDEDLAYATDDALLIVGRKDSSLWSLRDLNPRLIKGRSSDHPIWAGLGIGLTRRQEMMDLKTGQSLGVLGLKGVPSEYPWGEHSFQYATPYGLIDRETAVHVGTETLTVHSLPSGEIIEEKDIREVTVHSKRGTPGARMTTGHQKKIILLWKYGGEKVQVLDLPRKKSHVLTFDMNIHAVEFHPTERSFYVGLADNTLAFSAKKHRLKVFCSETFQELEGPPCLPSSTSEALLSHDGTLVLSEKGRISETAPGEKGISLEPKPSAVWTTRKAEEPFVGYLQKEKTLMGYSRDGRSRSLLSVNQKPSQVSISEDGKVMSLAFGGHSGSSVILMTDGKKETHVIEKSFGDGLYSDLSADGKEFLSSCNHISSIGGSSGHSLHLLGIEDGAFIHSRDQIVAFINMSILIPSSPLIGVAFANGVLQIRKREDLGVLWSLPLHSQQIRKITASPNGALLASIGADQRLLVTDLSRRKIILRKPFGFIPCDCEFSSNSEIVVVGPGENFFRYEIEQ